ncbi:MAG: hypothetical protein PHD06_03885 [Bacteroidales bacterium]|nr:hypothetical protein [Bacteroidales bacterium]MDD4384298.1 hypothetical protein [Bacteroidales bacterium]MDY0196745.1 hypothetical protein [Tenuifilaceae bacterium]
MTIILSKDETSYEFYRQEVFRYLAIFSLVFFLFLSCRNGEAPKHLPVSVTFQNSPIGNYSPQQIKKDWPQAKMLWGKLDRTLYTFRVVPSYAEIVLDKDNHVLRINYPAQKFGPIIGAQWRSCFQSVDEAFLSYRLFIPKDFDFVKGGKLPGLAGGGGNSGGQVPTGYDGWSARLMFHEGGEVAYYLYYPEQKSKYGEYYFWTTDSIRVKLPLDRWITLTHHLKMNTPKKPDGIIEAWLNGVKVFSTNSVRFRDTCSLGIDQILFSTFFGGDSPEWAPQSSIYLLFDDFLIEK